MRKHLLLRIDLQLFAVIVLGWSRHTGIFSLDIVNTWRNMSAENIVIVESPAKARTIGKMLGANYRILASMGHVRDLPEHSMGVDIENKFEPQYEITKDRVRIIKELQSAAKGATHIYLAPDPDREGEAIAWHLQEILKKNSKAEFRRVTFHEITRAAIDRAFKTPGKIDMHLVDAQQARRVLDRLVGYKISPLLWTRIEKGISAGRVQSVALRIVCEREREIIAFVPKEYWDFNAEFSSQAGASPIDFKTKLVQIDGQKAEIGNADDAGKIATAVRGAKNYSVASVDIKPVSRSPYPPFITSTLQQAAGGLGFSASATMQLAQQLYEGVELGEGGPVGLITYMRTDSVAVAQEAQSICRDYIASTHGNEYIPAKPNFYKSKASAQGAHEAIRPTDVSLTPDKAKDFLDARQLKLYTLIWRRFVASQMASAEQKRTTVEVEAQAPDSHKYRFRAVATVTTFPGFMKVYKASETEQDGDSQAPSALAELRTGQACKLAKLETEQKFTEPPARFSEAMLIKELEANGIGRPSTYASIVKTIQDRQYVLREKGRLIPSELGFKVNDFLVSSLPELFQIQFTAAMEEKLDKIEEGEVLWTAMLEEFYGSFSKWLDEVKNAGAPEGDKAITLLNLLDKVRKWAAPEKAGRRTYDDSKFVKSVREKFDEDGKITARQWEALLNMAVKYADQISGLETSGEKAGFSEELASARERVSVAQARREETASSSEDQAKYTEIFSLFEPVQWEKPEKRGARSYDDGKFFASLKRQAESGKLLSEKQRAVLSRLASKYKEQIKDYEKLAELLGVSSEAAEGDAANPAANAEKNAEIEALLTPLAQVKTWAEPVKKGPRVYDDKAFFESLSRQHQQGRKLSDKQVAALKKLASKYSAPAAPAD